MSKKSRKGLKLGHVGSKTRSLGQILGKKNLEYTLEAVVLIQSPGNCQNVYLHEIYAWFECWSCGIKNRSLGHILEKSCGQFGRYNFD